MNRPTKTSASDVQGRAILDAVRHIVRALRLTARESEQRLGLSSAQLFVLHRLRDEQALSLGELAARTYTDPSSVSVVVKRLVAKGLVERVRASSDGRKVTVTLSTEGKRALRRAPDPAQERFVAAIAALSPRKRRDLAVLLDEVVSNMGLGGKPGLFFEDETHGSNLRGGSDGAR